MVTFVLPASGKSTTGGRAGIQDEGLYGCSGFGADASDLLHSALELLYAGREVLGTAARTLQAATTILPTKTIGITAVPSTDSRSEMPERANRCNFACGCDQLHTQIPIRKENRVPGPEMKRALLLAAIAVTTSNSVSVLAAQTPPATAPAQTQAPTSESPHCSPFPVRRFRSQADDAGRKNWAAEPNARRGFANWSTRSRWRRGAHSRRPGRVLPRSLGGRLHQRAPANRDARIPAQDSAPLRDGCHPRIPHHLSGSDRRGGELRSRRARSSLPGKPRWKPRRTDFIGRSLRW